jgi:hypothetical protein
VALEDTAVRLIAKFGRSATLLRKSLTPDDPAAPWDSNDSEGASVPITAAFVAFKKDQIDGTVIHAGDMQVLIAAKATTPVSDSDTILDGGARWRIIATELIKPGSIEYLWKCQVRS